MNCIIVDDDLFSTRIISDFIKRTSILNLVRTFNNAIEAIDYLTTTEKETDIIFLDIEMPEMTGMDFIRSINIEQKQIIIYSSQEKYALESYEYDVCDYLLKPVTYTRFLKSVNKAKSELAKLKENSGPTIVDENNASNSDDDENADTVFVRENSGLLFRVRYNDVVYIEALENYVALVTTSKRYTIHTTMKNFIEKFPPNVVVRTHRSYAVGVRYINSVVDNSVVIDSPDDTRQIPIGKSYRDTMKKLLNDLCL